MNTTDAIEKLSEEIFEVVKEKVDAKVDKADIGYFEIDVTQIQTEPPTVTLTQSQMLEINKKYCIVKIIFNNDEIILYKSVLDDDELSSSIIIKFHSTVGFSQEQDVIELECIEMQVDTNTRIATFSTLNEEHYSKEGSDDKFQTLSNLRTSFQSTPSDTNYPSEKLVKDNLDSINDKIPSEASSSNKLADKDWANTQLGNKQPTIDSTHKLSSSLVDDTSSNNKFVPPYTEETFTFVLTDGTTVTKTLFIKTPTNN